MIGMHEAIAHTPQAAMLDRVDIARWIEGVRRYQSARADWHVRRLHGLGGSEIGAVLRHFLNNGESGHQSITQVVESKLLKRLPTYENHHMKRGTALEDLARLAFRFKYGAELDAQAMQAMNGPALKHGATWLVGNPDDLVLMRGRRFLVDYKVPNVFSENIDFDYDCQLHHYKLVAQMRNIQVDGLICAKLDIAPELAQSLVAKIDKMSREDLIEMAKMIAKTDVPGLRIVGLGLEMSRDRQCEILAYGAECWEGMVLQGVVPTPVKQQLIDLDDAGLKNIAKYQQQYALAKAGIKQLDEIASTAAAKMSQHLKGVDITTRAMPMTLVKVEPEKGFDSEALIAEALQRGADKSELVDQDKRKYSIPALIEEIKRLKGDAEAPSLFEPGAPDAAIARDYLEQAGVDVSPFAKSGLRIGISTKKEDQSTMKLLVRSASEVYVGWLDGFGANTPADEPVFEGALDNDLSLTVSPQADAADSKPKTIGMR